MQWIIKRWCIYDVSDIELLKSSIVLNGNERIFRYGNRMRYLKQNFLSKIFDVLWRQTKKKNFSPKIDIDVLSINNFNPLPYAIMWCHSSWSAVVVSCMWIWNKIFICWICLWQIFDTNQYLIDHTIWWFTFSIFPPTSRIDVNNILKCDRPEKNTNSKLNWHQTNE